MDFWVEKLNAELHYEVPRREALTFRVTILQRTDVGANSENSVYRARVLRLETFTVRPFSSRPDELADHSWFVVDPMFDEIECSGTSAHAALVDIADRISLQLNLHR